MSTTLPALQLIISIAKFQSVTARLYDTRLGQGIGLNDYLILYYLAQADGQRLRRIDLAEQVGLSASGVTKLLAPMEKIGLIEREANPSDARVSFVKLAPGGKRILANVTERAEQLAMDSVKASDEEIQLMLSLLR